MPTEGPDDGVAAARAAAQRLNESEMVAEWEARCVSLEKERDTLLKDKERFGAQVQDLQTAKSELEASLQSKASDLAASKRETKSEQDKRLNAEADGKSQAERSSRLELEGDRLREEIR